MSTDHVLDRVWNRLQTRVGADGCRCGTPDEAVRVLERHGLAPADLVAFRRGELSMADLTAGLEADLDPSAYDDLDGLAEALAAATGPADPGA